MGETTISLGELGLHPGESRTLNPAVPLEAYRQGGEDFLPPSDKVATRLDINAMDTGHAMRLRFEVEMRGPCARCLDEAVVAIRADAREVHDPRAGDDELLSEFVEGDQLDVQFWRADSVGSEFPTRVLCAEDCQGLCPICGVNHNLESCDCVTESADTRWDALKNVRFDDDSPVG